MHLFQCWKSETSYTIIPITHHTSHQHPLTKIRREMLWMFSHTQLQATTASISNETSLISTRHKQSQKHSVQIPNTRLSPNHLITPRDFHVHPRANHSQFSKPSIRSSSQRFHAAAFSTSGTPTPLLNVRTELINGHSKCDTLQASSSPRRRTGSRRSTTSWISAPTRDIPWVAHRDRPLMPPSQSSEPRGSRTQRTQPTMHRGTSISTNRA